ncbi:MAG TPA: hypothetical protein VFI70_01510 [Nitrososphaeraceae archaeon]|nr:hypothetical protein [Nitrososphaeraceae archaeon]
MLLLSTFLNQGLITIQIVNAARTNRSNATAVSDGGSSSSIPNHNA